MYSFANYEPVSCSMSSSNRCFFSHKQVSQETGEVVWYSHLFKNFPQFVVIHTVKGFGTVSEAEVGVFLALSCFLHDPVNGDNLTPGFPRLFNTQRVHLKFLGSHTAKV